MKLTTFFLILSIGLCYTVEVFSQSTALSLNIKNKPIKDVFKEIESKSQYIFFYYDGVLDINKKISINVKNQAVDKILDKIFEKTNNTYIISDRQIFISKKEDKSEANTPQQSSKRQVKGRIYDEHGNALPGVSIIVKGLKEGVATDINGNYTISAANGQTLLFSYLGYKTEEVLLSKKTTIDVILKEDVKDLEEVIVVGMGTQRKASVIGAISSAKVSDLRISSRSITNSLAGRMAGIIAVQRSGEPGFDNASFWIRGISTFGDNKTPLILVDGVERPMDNLDPEEIENVSILKDASATAVYGARAANGVVLVATRKGSLSAKPVIELKMEYGVSQLTRTPQLLDGVNYMKLYNEAAGKDVYRQEQIEATANGSDPYLYPNVNWYDEIFKDNSDNGIISLNVHGGGTIARYFVVLGVFNENGNLRNNPQSNYNSNISLNRYNFRTNVNLSVTKSTLLDVELGGYLIDAHYPGSTTVSLFDRSLMATPINIPVRYPYGENKDGSTKYVWAGTHSTDTKNPAGSLMGSGFSTEYRTQTIGQTRLSQDFGQWINGLSANVAFSFDSFNQTTTKRHKNESYYLANGRDENGNLELEQTFIGDEYLGYDKSLLSNRAIELKFQLNYERLFSDAHRVGAMTMYYQRDYRIGNAEDAIASLPFRKQGIALRTIYAYNDRYFAEFNLGYNGSENFSKNQRFGIFPAGAVGYLISGEEFWYNSRLSSIINVLKIKGSLGLVGAEALPGGRRYGYLTIVDEGLGGYHFGWDRVYYNGTGENQLGASDLSWEKGLKSNVGLQIELWNRILSLELDYFHEKRANIFIPHNSLPGMAGISNKPFTNLGEMKNQGIDGTIEINHTLNNIYVRAYANATFTKNKIIEEDEPERKYPYQNRTGKKYGQQFGLISLGYFKDQAEIDASPEQQFGTVRPGDIKYQDVNRDGMINSYDEVAIGYSDIPELVYGFGFQVGYRGVDVGLFFRGQGRVSYMLGGEGFIPFKEGGDRGNLFEKALDRWTEDNPRQDAFYPRLSVGNTENNYRNSTKWLYDGSFLRLADLEVGYNFPKKQLIPFSLNGVRIYFHGSNIALFSPFKMWDPEIGRGRGDAYPLQRKMNIGLRISF